MDNERPVGNEKRPMLKRAKISCFNRLLTTSSLIDAGKRGKIGPFLALVRQFISVLQILGKVKNW